MRLRLRVWFVTAMVPWCASTMDFVMARPRPQGSGTSRAGGVGSPEAVEDVFDLTRFDARSVVVDAELDDVRSAGQRHRGGLLDSSMHTNVLQQVVDDLAKLPGITGNRCTAGGREVSVRSGSIVCAATPASGGERCAQSVKQRVDGHPRRRARGGGSCRAGRGLARGAQR